MAFYNDLVTEIKGFLKRNSGIPPGFIMGFGGKTVPAGWLPCDGSAVSRTQYADLFAAIGTSWGEGDGSTTFNVPDLRDRVMQGAKSFDQVGKYLEASLPNITGSSSFYGDHGFTQTHAIVTGAFTKDGKTGGWSTSGANNGGRDLTFDASASNSLYSGANIQPSASLTLLCIKT